MMCGMWPTVPPTGAGAVAAMARRLGPLPYSVLGVREGPAPPVAAGEIAAGLDRWWVALGRPDPFVVVEEGAGDGSLAAGLIAARPACAACLRYVLVEARPSLRAAQNARLALEPPAQVLGPVIAAEGGDDEAPVVAPNEGPLATSLAERPALRCHALFTAGWLSSLPVDVWERRPGGWVEIRLASGPGEGLVEVAVPVEDHLPAAGVPEGWRVPVQHAASVWMHEALSGAARVVAVIDRFVATTGELAVAPGAPPPPPALALDQLDRQKRCRLVEAPSLSPLLIAETDVGSVYG